VRAVIFDLLLFLASAISGVVGGAGLARCCRFGESRGALPGGHWKQLPGGFAYITGMGVGLICLLLAGAHLGDGQSGPPVVPVGHLTWALIAIVVLVPLLTEIMFALQAWRWSSIIPTQGTQRVDHEFKALLRFRWMGVLVVQLLACLLLTGAGLRLRMLDGVLRLAPWQSALVTGGCYLLLVNVLQLATLGRGGACLHLAGSLAVWVVGFARGDHYLSAVASCSLGAVTASWVHSVPASPTASRWTARPACFVLATIILLACG
jgi:hypothetical protein